MQPLQEPGVQAAVTPGHQDPRLTKRQQRLVRAIAADRVTSQDLDPTPGKLHHPKGDPITFGGPAGLQGESAAQKRVNPLGPSAGTRRSQGATNQGGGKNQEAGINYSEPPVFTPCNVNVAALLGPEHPRTSIPRSPGYAAGRNLCK